MGSSIKVTGVACNINCVYCYEGNLRKEVQNEVKYDLNAIEKAMEERYGKDGSSAPNLHGGEALIISKLDVERLLKKMYELHGSSSVQTNGVLIDEEYIEMFKRYKTSVGISFDGPWPLNKLRVAGNGMSTKEATERTQQAIYRLHEAGISVGLIIVLHRANASPQYLPKLKEFVLEMSKMGIGGRLNLCIIDDPILKAKQELTEEEAADVYRDLARFVLVEHPELKMRWQPFRDIVDNLLGNGLGTCIFHPCSYYEADGERVIMGDGSLANCLKTAKSNYVYLREPETEKNHVREEILSQTPYEYGGCKGCRYWRVCYGVCPSEGIDGDWRNRSRFCKAYYGAYETVAQHLKALLPNIELVVDTEPTSDDWYQDYRERSGYGYRHDPFELMTQRGSSIPSSWKFQARGHRKARQAQPQRLVENGVSHGDRPHGDHSDHADQ